MVNLSRTFLELLQYLSSWNTNSLEASFCSPQVAETLIWFMERWSKSYLLIDEDDYGYVRWITFRRVLIETHSAANASFSIAPILPEYLASQVPQKAKDCMLSTSLLIKSKPTSSCGTQSKMSSSR